MNTFSRGPPRIIAVVCECSDHCSEVVGSINVDTRWMTMEKVGSHHLTISAECAGELN